MTYEERIESVFTANGPRGLTAKDVFSAFHQEHFARAEVLDALERMLTSGVLSFNSGTDRYHLERAGDVTAPKQRTSDSLREMLFNEIERLSSGASDAKTAKAISDLAGRVIESARLEIEFAVKTKDLDGVKMGQLRLGPPADEA